MVFPRLSGCCAPPTFPRALYALLEEEMVREILGFEEFNAIHWNICRIWHIARFQNNPELLAKNQLALRAWDMEVDISGIAFSDR